MELIQSSSKSITYPLLSNYVHSLLSVLAYYFDHAQAEQSNSATCNGCAIPELREGQARTLTVNVIFNNNLSVENLEALSFPYVHDVNNGCGEDVICFYILRPLN